MKVQDVMTSEVKICGPDADAAAAAMIMWNNDCGAVPVCDDAGKVIGIITDRDICMAAATTGRAAPEIKVNEVMSARVYACAPDDDIREALRIMREQQLRRLAVVDDSSALIGILSISDIVLHAEKGKSKKHISRKEALDTLKAICQPRTPKQGENAVQGL